MLYADRFCLFGALHQSVAWLCIESTSENVHHLNWTLFSFIAIQCEDCYTYNPCISICPRKTCDNRLVYDTLTKDCGKETCVEGCDIEPCPPGQVNLILITCGNLFPDDTAIRLYRTWTWTGSINSYYVGD